MKSITHLNYRDGTFSLHDSIWCGVLCKNDPMTQYMGLNNHPICSVWKCDMTYKLDVIKTKLLILVSATQIGILFEPVSWSEVVNSTPESQFRPFGTNRM